MQIETYSKDKLFIVKPLERRLDAKVSLEFKEAITDFVNKGYKNVLINLEKVEFIDSSGLGSIVACLKHIGKEGNLKLCSLKPSVKSLIELTKLQKVFQIFSGEKEATGG